ncbi:aldo/keto reductase [Ancylobacter amanitiformis]|uniref:Diketogulonate reductase-like aldo/keto reductase n=1 Tax=Ancylobacter amanitiformis TaxID=217069 RepID=A0ABU0LWT5_9HYPH|nr:aldo/keto reductase [Ancylobacter amanitiformis]MDQ0513130.1 diketogulonate reductase-like aldo/keto reductase [Ancylobacter amanitiformis]
MQPYVSANGARIPALGYGTFRLSGPDTLRMVPHVLQLGFRHIDTAQAYGNEAEVGEGIQTSGVNRADIFLTTKVWVDKYGHDALVASVDESLKKLRTDYVDLLLLHWPAGHALPEPVGALNDVVKAGKVRHIGVSNFNVAQMQEAVRLSATPLVTNQVEYHPYLDQSPIVRAARAAGLSVTAYFAMADGKVFADPVLKDIAGARGKSVAQVVLRWVIQQDGLIALSKTAGEARAAENFAVFDFELSSDEMAAIHALARPDGRIVSPAGLAPVWDAA